MPNNFQCFDGGLEISNLAILFKINGNEKHFIESCINYENFLKTNFPNEYTEFLDYKCKVKETQDIKSLIFDRRDGKTDLPGFELYDVYMD